MSSIRYYPSQSSAQKIERADAPGAEVWYYEVNGAPFAYGWRTGREINHAFHHRFRDAEQRDKFVTGFFDGVKLRVEYKQERQGAVREKNAQANPFQEGDILVNSWGYDQTNVDFYQVVRVTTKSVVLREIASEAVKEVGPMAEKVVARRDQFISAETVTKRVRWSGSKPCVSMDHGHCGLWDGSPEYSSSYH